MADPSSYWSDWANNITVAPKSPPSPSRRDSDIDTYNNRDLPMWQRVGLPAPPSKDQLEESPPISGPSPASQQPTIPIQTAQGAPQTQGQSLQTAPNSGVVGQSPYSNQALTGGSGMPIGGLPTQSPAPNFNSPQQVNPQQMQMPPLTGPQRMNPQLLQMLMQRLAQRPAALRGYGLLG